MTLKKYFTGKKTIATLLIQGFLVLLFVFSVVFFVWSLMQYNEIMEDKKEDEAYIEQLNDEIEELQYLIDAPLDDTFKIRIAREKLGMCFPDEIIFYTEME
ncbi:MAG: septum formation initiator family protein [Clostridia bacterium]|nr:septum formation initiator family protein [Clostridia bacterium]